MELPWAVFLRLLGDLEREVVGTWAAIVLRVDSTEGKICFVEEDPLTVVLAMPSLLLSNALDNVNCKRMVNPVHAITRILCLTQQISTQK